MTEVLLFFHYGPAKAHTAHCDLKWARLVKPSFTSDILIYRKRIKSSNMHLTFSTHLIPEFKRVENKYCCNKSRKCVSTAPHT